MKIALKGKETHTYADYETHPPSSAKNAINSVQKKQKPNDLFCVKSYVTFLRSCLRVSVRVKNKREKFMQRAKATTNSMAKEQLNEEKHALN